MVTHSELYEVFPTLLIALLVRLYYRNHSSGADQKYSTFGPRFWAPSVDQVILWPLTFAGLKLASLLPSPGLGFFLAPFVSFLPLAYSVYFHGRYGATPGKQVCKVRIVDARTEKPITYQQAFVRDGIPLCLLAGTMVYALAAGNPPVLEESKVLQAVGCFFLAWFAAEILTMLTNRKRRALHDFLAGTVVIRTDIVPAESREKDFPATRSVAT